MDRKPQEIRPLQSESTRESLSAFEISLRPEHQPTEFQLDSFPEWASNPKVGEICPNCRSAKIDYDGLLNLSCPKCGYTLAGCFT